MVFRGDGVNAPQSMPFGAPVENVVAMVEALRE